jgi:uncharacterized protein (TIGR02266 family)
MRIKLKYPDVETFIQKYAVNISRGGIFIATKQPKAVGTILKFEFLLSNPEGTSLIRGEGQVQWVREFDPAQPARAHGMGVKFTRLDPESQQVVERALAYRDSKSSGTRKLPGESEGHALAKEPPPGATPEPIQLPPSEPMRVVRKQTPPPPPPDEPTMLERPRTPPGEVLATERELPVPAGPEVPLKPERGPGDPTREVAMPDVPDQRVTRPIDLAEAEREAEAQRAREGGKPRKKNGGWIRRGPDEIDELAREWGITEDKWKRTLSTRWRPKGAEATRELEQLMGKPPKPPTPTLAEAIQKLAALLGKNPR